MLNQVEQDEMSRRPKFDPCSSTLTKIAQSKNVNKQGYLSVILGSTKGRYYFTLVANMLFAFEDHSKGKIVGCIYIEGCVLKSPPQGGKEITLTTEGNIMWTLEPEDDSTDSWFANIKQHSDNTSDISGAGNVGERIQTMSEQIARLEQENAKLRKLSMEYEQAAKKIVGFKDAAKKDIAHLKRQLQAKDKEAREREKELAKARAEAERVSAKLTETQDAHFRERKGRAAQPEKRASWGAVFCLPG